MTVPYLDFPSSRWRRLRTNNVQERANREIKRRSCAVQVPPLHGLAGVTRERCHVRAERNMAGAQVLRRRG
ncbi:MAG: transposase [Collinsella sp.]